MRLKDPHHLLKWPPPMGSQRFELSIGAGSRVEGPAAAAGNTLKGLSPGDMEIIRKRQEWRVTFAQMILEHVETSQAALLAKGQETCRRVEALQERFGQVARALKHKVGELLGTEVDVDDLEGKRDRANIFLDEMILILQDQFQSETGHYLSLSELVENHGDEARAGLIQLADTQMERTLGFVENMIQLHEFNEEIVLQRWRIRLLLGADRKMGELFPSNEQVIGSRVDEFWRNVDIFGSLVQYIAPNLSRLLMEVSPYSKLEEQLRIVKDALLVTNRFVLGTFPQKYRQTKERDIPLMKLRIEFKRISDTFIQVKRGQLLPLLKGIAEKDSHVIFLKIYKFMIELYDIPNILSAFHKDHLLTCIYFLIQSDINKEDAQVSDSLKTLDRIQKQILELAEKTIPGLIKTLNQIVKNLPVLDEDTHDGLKKVLLEINACFNQTISALVSPAMASLLELRNQNVLHLKRELCATVGKVRCFFQDSFSKIAAVDPRSHKEPEYFFKKEFSKELKRDLKLRDEVIGLHTYLKQLERFERRQVVQFEVSRFHPSGEEGRRLVKFVSLLRGELVPHVDKICLLSGVWDTDKKELSTFSDQLFEKCTVFLTCHDFGFEVKKEMGRIRTEEGGEGVLRKCQAFIDDKTCRQMSLIFQGIHETFKGLITFVGLMSEGINHRATILIEGK